MLDQPAFVKRIGIEIRRVRTTLPATHQVSSQLGRTIRPCVVGARNLRRFLLEELLKLGDLLVQLPEDQKTALLGPGRASLLVGISLKPEEDVSRRTGMRLPRGRGRVQPSDLRLRDVVFVAKAANRR